jgi:hypothetical protein
MSVKVHKLENFRFLVNTPEDELIDDEDIGFKGETEYERMKSVAAFTRIRSILQKYTQTLTVDDSETLFTCMKLYLVSKKPDKSD